MMQQDKRVVLAVDMGGSKYIGGLVAEDGEILYHKRQLWDSYQVDRVLASICGAIDDVMARFPGWHFSAIGITIPGLADPRRGIYVESDVMEIYDWPVAAIVSVV